MDNLPIAQYWLTGFGSWALSYLLHSSVILVAVLLVIRSAHFISQSSKDVLLKMALVAAMLTASIGFVQSSQGSFVRTIVLDLQPVSGRLTDQPAAQGRLLSTANLSFFAPEPTSESLAAHRTGALNINWLALLLSGWLLGTMLFAGLFCYRWWSFKRRVGQRRPLSHQPSIDLCIELQQKMGIGRSVKLTHSKHIDSPMAIGLAEVCLPTDLWLQLDEEQMRAIVAHELAHLQRLDPLWLFFWHLMSIVFFFQPLNKLSLLSFQSRAEFLADATAVRQTKDPVAMVNSLISAAQLAKKNRLGLLGVPLVGQGATIVERSRLLLTEKLITTTTSLTFIVVAALLLVSLSVILLPSISLASKASTSEQWQTLNPTNALPWTHFSDSRLRFASNIDYHESIAGKQLELMTKRVTFDPELDGIAVLGPFARLRLVKKSIYGTTRLLIDADWQGNGFYRYEVDGKSIADQQAATTFIQQMLDEGLGMNDEFKRRMLRLYEQPNGFNNQYVIDHHLSRLLENTQSWYSAGDIAMARLMLSPDERFKTEPLIVDQPLQFYNAMAYKDGLSASFSELGYLNIHYLGPNGVNGRLLYNLNDQRLMQMFLQARNEAYRQGVSEKALVAFLVRLHFNAAATDIHWLQE